MRKKMKSLKILTTALIASLFAVSSFADINLSGDGRYRFGIMTDASGEDSTYRNGRMRMTVKAGNDNGGIEMRVRTNFTETDSAESLYVDRRNAFFKLGGLKVTMGEVGAYTGLLGTYYRGSEFTGAGAIRVSGGNDMFSGWISHETTDNGAAEKPDFVTYNLSANVQGVNVSYTSRPGSSAFGDPSASTSDWTTAAFQDVVVSGTFGGASVDVNSSKSDAVNSDALLARVSVPVGGLTVKLGYAKMEGGYSSQDWGTLLGEGIFSAHYGQGNLAGSGNATDANDYTGVAVSGSMGDISYQVAGGSYDDNNASTSNGYYDIRAFYSIDSSTSLNFGMGKARGIRGMGIEATYSF